MNFSHQHPNQKRSRNGRQRGQTLVIALIVLGLLLIVGFVFIGIVNRNIQDSGRNQRRSVAADLAEAGIRYAHGQLVQSELGADWRGIPVNLPSVAGNPDFTLDPDAYYLRSGQPTLKFRPDRPNDVGPLDLGGPDGLGPFIRIPFANGRALVRVRLAPSDANVFTGSPTGALRNPGAARNYLIIESIGRQGRLNPNDPTSLASTQPVRFQNFATTAMLQNSLTAMRAFDAQSPNSRRLVAFASTGLTDHARFITNKYNVTRPADIGIPGELGAQYLGAPVSGQVVSQLGTPGVVRGNGITNIPQGFGSIYSNADLVIHGRVRVGLNSALGDQIDVAGSLSGASGASLEVTRYDYQRPTSIGPGIFTAAPAVTLTDNGTLSLNSRSANYSTVGGVIRDGLARTDQQGFSRGVGKLVPPSLLTSDSETKRNRYLTMTRESGIAGNGVNSGYFGHGRGVYIDNVSDRQEAADESGRKNADQQSVVYDWLNPNNGDSNSGWRGNFYVPRGCFVQLLPDGWTIQRDASGPANERTWKNPDGSDSGRSTIRFRVGIVNGALRVVNTLTPGVNINAATAAVGFQLGLPFNGVIYFEGNARVRGVIPTNVQLTLVSHGTIYIEGSILKGVIGNDVTAAQGVANYNAPLTQPSRSTLMLAAKDYVTVNTTQFFGTSPNQALEEVNDTQNVTSFNPLRLRSGGGSADGRLSFFTELALDPENATDPFNPTTWRPYAMGYQDSITPANRISTQLLLTHAMDDGVAPATFISMNINYGAFDTNPSAPVSAYNFPGDLRSTGGLLTNTASTYLGTGVGSIPVYGMGTDPWQRYNQFETRAFQIIDPANSTYAPDGTISANTPNAEPFARYRLFANSSNDFLIRPNRINNVPSNDYFLARAAIVPNDIRIEASVFAEEGSFFVIPGRWFNTHTNDIREDYVASAGIYAGATTDLERNQRRLEAHGNSPDVPFYGEPLDVRVVLVGSVTENMPPAMSVQGEWIRKWGWIPRSLGSTGLNIPSTHSPNAGSVVPNLMIQYDPVLATSRVNGFNTSNDPTTLVRADEYGRALPPMPRLPVSPALTYFGEVK